MLEYLSKSKCIILGGLVFGALGALAVNWGNPANMGIDIAGFLRDIAGGLKLQSDAAFQYLRPEIFGFVLGAFGTSIVFHEWRPRGGSSPLVRFVLAVCVMAGALVFLGDPVRMLLRLSGGDLSALVALGGFIAGVFAGVLFLKSGFSLGRVAKVPPAAGLIVPIFALILFVLLVIKSGVLAFTSAGVAPGGQHINVWLGLGVGLIIGFIIQRTRFCTIGGWRDIFLAKDFYLFGGLVAFLMGALATNYIVGNLTAGGLLSSPNGDIMYHWGIGNQNLSLPYADAAQYIWTFLGFILVGLAATQMGGCPLRNLTLAGEGDTDAGVSVLGYTAGGAIAVNFLTVSNAGTAGGLGKYAPWAVAAGLAFCLATGFMMKENVTV